MATAGLSAQKVEYFVEKSGDSMFSALRAKANGKTYTLIDKSKEMCLSVADQKDFDGNGLTDALVEHITACGGNCCPNAYFFVSALGNGRFEVGTDLADSWADPVVEKWKGLWSVVIVSTNEGANTDPAQEITHRYVLRAGQGVAVEESQRREIASVVEMRSGIFKGSEDEHTIEYDLDGDGRKDRISGKLWERWGRIFWSVHFANGQEFTTKDACKRIGVLKTTTHGVHDLVCDQDTVYRWSGREYQVGAAGSAHPSFDCAKAATPVELLICRDDRLAALDVEAAAAYKQALSRLSPEGQLALRRDHLAWFKDYSRTCNQSANDDDRTACVARFLSGHDAELTNQH